MDPIAHTLAGATLSQTGLKHRTPLATATLIIGANLPDIDGIMSFWGADVALYYRRGMTHGILAQLLLPWVLWVGILAYDRWVRRALAADRPPVKPWSLLLLAYIGVLSHPFLDWLNTYGVRLLMPISGRWFYGDTLFIIDAWMWLLMAAAAVFAYSRSRVSQGLWIGLGLATSSLITFVDFVPMETKVVWWLGLGILVLARSRGVTPLQNQGVAVACLCAFCLYLSAMFAGNQRVRQRVELFVNQQFGDTIEDIMVGPLPGQPFHREIIAVGKQHYYGWKMAVWEGAEILPLFERLPRPPVDPIITKALQNEDIRGFVNWMRFPIYELKEVAEGYQVTIRDLRYVRPGAEGGRGIGLATTLVPR